MDEYYKLAADYFKTFESRSAFPSLKSYHWYFYIISLFGFGYFSYRVFFSGLASVEKPMALMLVTEVLFLISGGLIALHRFKSTVRTTTPESELKPIERLAIAKRTKLEAMFKCPSCQFTQVVTSIEALRTLEAKYRNPMDASWVESLGKLFQTKTRIRLLALLASVITAFAAWISQSEGYSFNEVISDSSKMSLIAALSKLIGITFIALVGLYVMCGQLLSILPALISSLLPALRSDAVILDYLLHDLIRYQTMPSSEHTSLRTDPPVLTSFPQHGNDTDLPKSPVTSHAPAMHEESAALNIFNLAGHTSEAVVNTK